MSSAYFGWFIYSYFLDYHCHGLNIRSDSLVNINSWLWVICWNSTEIVEINLENIKVGVCGLKTLFRLLWPSLVCSLCQANFFSERKWFMPMIKIAVAAGIAASGQSAMQRVICSGVAGWIFLSGQKNSNNV